MTARTRITGWRNCARTGRTGRAGPARDPSGARREPEASRRQPASRRPRRRGREAACRGGRETRDAAAQPSERRRAETEARVNRSWRDASTALDRLRRSTRRTIASRGDIERRIADAERACSREGFRGGPGRGAGGARGRRHRGGRSTKRQELVQRRLATARPGQPAARPASSSRCRSDTTSCSASSTTCGRPGATCIEVIAQVDREITETFTTAYRDVAMQFERLDRGAVPRRGGTPRPHRPGRAPSSRASRSRRSPGRKRVKRISLLSGGERSLTALAFLFAIFTARPSPVLPDG